MLLGLTSIVLGIAGGLAMALARIYGATLAAGLAVVYIDVFRAIPLLVLLVIIYYALPFVGIRLTSFAAAAAAALAGVLRLRRRDLPRRIEAVPRGQFEAARAPGPAPGGR